MAGKHGFVHVLLAMVVPEGVMHGTSEAGGHCERHGKCAKEDCIVRGDGMTMTKIPRFRTEQEMREFWDTHDSAEYFEDMGDDEVILDTEEVGRLVNDAEHFVDEIEGVIWDV